MRIEKLEPSRRKPGRWLVWLEDGSLVRVGEGDVIRLSLYQGQELTEDAADALAAAAGANRLRERAAELLSARAMSRKELLDRLTAPPRRRRASEEEQPPEPEEAAAARESLRRQAETVADRMEQLGLLDDREYGRAIARHYAAKGFGPRRVREELYRRGVPREYWEDALAELPSQREDGGRLDELVRKKLRGVEPTRAELKKVSDYLARRGFGWEEISGALERYAARQPDEYEF